MSELLFTRLAHIASHQGFDPADTILLAGALNLAKSMRLDVDESNSTRDILADAADRLKPRSETDGLAAAVDWLRDPSVREDVLVRMDEEIASLVSNGGDGVHWDEELAAALDFGLSRGAIFGMRLPIARALANILEIPPSAKCVCTFAPSASIAWCIAESRPVRLYTGDPDVARLFAMFAAGSGRSLSVDRRNPLDGSFMPVISELAARDRSPVQEADYLVSVPPFGFKVRDTDDVMVAVESLQIERLRRFAREEFLTIIPDGFLFRDSRSEVRIRRQIISETGVQVDSLPAGIFGRSTGVSTSLMRLDNGGTRDIHFVNGRTMPAQSSGKIQERLLIQHLGAWDEIVADSERTISVLFETVAENNYILTPDRYLRPRALQAVQKAASDLPQVSLLDVATIERGKAPRPMHELGAEPALVCREVAPADLQGGVVSKPQREVAFSADEADRASNVAVRAGDILVSIKGNVGAFGIVPPSAPDPKSDEPWIISQSLAIIRFRPNPHVPSPEILNAILTAPWVRENLDRLAGGSTVRSLSMSDLRQVQIPLLAAEDFQSAKEGIDWIATQRREIDEKLTRIEDGQRMMWMKLWGINPAEQGDTFYA